MSVFFIRLSVCVVGCFRMSTRMPEYGIDLYELWECLWWLLYVCASLCEGGYLYASILNGPPLASLAPVLWYSERTSARFARSGFGVALLLALVVALLFCCCCLLSMCCFLSLPVAYNFCTLSIFSFLSLLVAYIFAPFLKSIWAFGTPFWYQKEHRQ